jgi:hypothetical protein
MAHLKRLAYFIGVTPHRITVKQFHADEAPSRKPRCPKLSEERGRKRKGKKKDFKIII